MDAEMPVLVPDETRHCLKFFLADTPEDWDLITRQHRCAIPKDIPHTRHVCVCQAQSEDLDGR